MNGFTPATALVGGGLIGLAALLLFVLNGRIAGVSGIASGLWRGASGERAWRALFLLGLILGAGTWAWVAGRPSPRVGFPPALLVAAGLLVGWGTSLAGGCTSGHGVCGLSRFSLRSLVNVLAFMGAGFATVYVMRHLG